MKREQTGKMYKLCLERINATLDKDSMLLQKLNQNNPSVSKEIQKPKS